MKCTTGSHGDRARSHRPFPGWHRAIAHTADVGLRAAAGTGERLLEEAAAALAELSNDVGPTQGLRSQGVEIEADDLEQLVFHWLNELIGLAEIRGEALVRTAVTSLHQGRAGWVVRSRAWFAPFDGMKVRPRLQVKAVTMHRLCVTRGPDGWALEAYLDV
ncbi:MAG: archease [Candidatus Limnocylindria bacterium]